MEAELKFAKRAIAQIAQMGGQQTQLLLAYIKLFSALEQPLSLEQTYEILTEVNEFWANYPAQIWQVSVQKLLVQQRSGSLKMPLENHDALIAEMELAAQLPQPPPPNTHKPPQFVRPTEQEKAHAARCVQNMMSAIKKHKF